MMNEPLSSIMTKQVITATSSDNLTKVKEIMDAHRVHHVPIVDGQKLVGLVSTYDLLKLNIRFEEYANCNIADVMTTHLATLNPDDKVGSAAEVFMEHLFHAIPIVDDNHNLVGIVTTHDVLRFEYYREYPEEQK